MIDNFIMNIRCPGSSFFGVHDTARQGGVQRAGTGPGGEAQRAALPVQRAADQLVAAGGR